MQQPARCGGGTRTVFICHSIKFINPNTLHCATKPDSIYYKHVVNGVIYVLKFNSKTAAKQHSTVNRSIELLDATLKLHARIDATFFHSINDDPTLSGSKVLSFGRAERKENHLYRQLFDERDSVLSDVNVWSKEDAVRAATVNEDQHLQATFTPGRESGSVNMFSGDQHAAASSSISSTKLRRLLETDMVPSSFNPICSKQQRAASTKISSNFQIKGGGGMNLFSDSFEIIVCSYSAFPQSLEPDPYLKEALS